LAGAGAAAEWFCWAVVVAGGVEVTQKPLSFMPSAY
jgi:hypothetical protein